MRKRIKSVILVLFLFGVMMISLEIIWIPPLELKPLMLEVQGENAAFCLNRFGSLQIRLPIGWEVESRITEDGQTQCVLVDAHSLCINPQIEAHNKFYEHDIIITPYEITVLPDSQMQVLADLMKEFGFSYIQNLMAEGSKPQDNVWLAAASDKELCMDYYFLLSTSAEGRKELFVISESWYSSYENELESFYLDFSNTHHFKVNDGQIALSETEQYRAFEKVSYFNEGTEHCMLAWIRPYDEGSTIKMYAYGDYKEPLCYVSMQEIDIQEVQILDINGDGYDDFLPDYFWDFQIEKGEIRGYLWKPEQEIFEYVDSNTLLTQYKEVLVAAGEYVIDLDATPFMEDSSGEELASSKSDDALAGKESEAESTQTEKESEASGVENVLTEADKIPEELIDTISKALVQDKNAIKATMDAMVCDRELTEREVKALAENNTCIKNAMLEIGKSKSHNGCWVMVDADNDGIEDVFLQQYLGGSLGVVYYYLFQGTKDGSYIETYMGSNLKEEFAFIEWEGKNYLSQTTYDFNKKLYDGIRLTEYKDGIFCNEASIGLVKAEQEDTHHVEITYLADEKYKDVLWDSILLYKENYDAEDTTTIGTAESYDEAREEYKWQSDFDNDGMKEEYSKSIWYPSNSYTRMCLDLEMKDFKEGNKLLEILRTDDATDMWLWVDESEWGNIIYILYDDALYDCHITAYLLSGDEFEKLMQVNFTYDLAVNVERRFEEDGFYY